LVSGASPFSFNQPSSSAAGDTASQEMSAVLQRALRCASIHKLNQDTALQAPTSAA
jgi:hypothetical protein